MFKQRFASTEAFLQHCYQERGLSITVLQFILQEQDHELLDECIRILLRTGRWDISKKNKIEDYTIPAQFPFQDEAFALSLGINQGYLPSSPQYPLCLHFQHGNPIILDTFYLLRQTTNLTTVEQYDELISKSTIRQLQHELLTGIGVKHHFTRTQIDLYLYAEFLTLLLQDPNELFHHWFKLESSSELLLQQFVDQYPQFSELGLNKLSRYRILQAIWSLPHPRLFALITANRAESIINKTQCLILLEKRQLPYILSFIHTTLLHINTTKHYQLESQQKQSQEADSTTEQSSSTTPPSTKSTITTSNTKLPVSEDYYNYFKTIYMPELDQNLGITGLLPENYLQSYNLGFNNPLNGGTLQFTSFEHEITYLEGILLKYRQLLYILWCQYDWLSFPSSLQVAVMILIEFAPKSIDFLPWLPQSNKTLILQYNKTIVDNLHIVIKDEFFHGENIPIQNSTTILPPSLASLSSSSSISNTTTSPPKPNVTTLPQSTPQLKYDPNLDFIREYRSDMKQLLHDNRHSIMKILTNDLYGNDILVIAPDFQSEVNNDSKLGTMDIVYSKGTRSPQNNDDELFLTLSNSSLQSSLSSSLTNGTSNNNTPTHDQQEQQQQGTNNNNNSENVTMTPLNDSTISSSFTVVDTTTSTPTKDIIIDDNNSNIIDQTSIETTPTNNNEETTSKTSQNDDIDTNSSQDNDIDDENDINNNNDNTKDSKTITPPILHISSSDSTGSMTVTTSTSSESINNDGNNNNNDTNQITTTTSTTSNINSNEQSRSESELSSIASLPTTSDPKLKSTDQTSTTTSPLQTTTITTTDLHQSLSTSQLSTTQLSTISSTSTSSIKSCLPLDQRIRRQKRTVTFNSILYHTDDSKPVVRSGRTLGHDDDLQQHIEMEKSFNLKLKAQMLRVALVFATISNLTHVIDYILDETNRPLNELMTITDGTTNQQQQSQQSPLGRDKPLAFENLIAAACYIPHCHPSTIQYLLKRRSKLCTNNKTGRDNNAFFVLYQNEPFWLYSHYKYTKLLILWLQVKLNERVYKPHLDVREFILATINLIYSNSLSFWFFIFILENLLSQAERIQAKQNAIRICDLLNIIYNPSHISTSTQSLIPNPARLLGPPGTQQGHSRQHITFPTHFQLQQLSLYQSLPPIINHNNYNDVNTTASTSTSSISSSINNSTSTTSSTTLSDSYNNTMTNTDGSTMIDSSSSIESSTTTSKSTTPSSSTTKSTIQYSPIISPPSETYLPSTTTLRDAYQQYECQQRFVFLTYFINKNTISLFLPPSSEYIVTEEFPSEIFIPTNDITPSIASTTLQTWEKQHKINLPPKTKRKIKTPSSTPPPQSSQSMTLPIDGDIGDDIQETDDNNDELEIEDESLNDDENINTLSISDLNSTLGANVDNIIRYLDVQKSLTQLSTQSLELLNIISPIVKNDLTNGKTLKSNLHAIIAAQYILNELNITLNNTNQQFSLSTNSTSTPATSSSTTTTPTSSQTTTLPSFLLSTNTNHLSTPQRGQQRDHLQQLIFPFLECRDLNAIRYLLDLGVSSKQMWQRVLAVQQLFFEIRDIVEYIPIDLYTNRHNYNIMGFQPTNLIEKPWLTLGNELQDIIDMKCNPIINPNNPTEIIRIPTTSLQRSNSRRFSNSTNVIPQLQTTTTTTTNVDENNNNNDINSDDDDTDYSNLPPLCDIDELIEKGESIEDLFGFNSIKNQSQINQLIFQSPNTNPFLTKEFLTIQHTSPMLQMIQLFLLYDNSFFETSLTAGPRNLSTTACLLFNWPIVQALYLTNTDTFVPQGDVSKYQSTIYCYSPHNAPNNTSTTTSPSTTTTSLTTTNNTTNSNVNDKNYVSILDMNQPPQQDVYREYHYNIDQSPFYKHDLLSILSQPIHSLPTSSTTTSLPQHQQVIINTINTNNINYTIEQSLPPRIYSKLMNPILSQLRSEHFQPTFTPQFHVDFLHVLLMFLLPQRNINPIQNYFSMQLFEFVFSHVLREYSIFGQSQRDDILVYLRRSFVVHSFLPQSEKGLYDGPIEGIIRLIAQNAKDTINKQNRFKEQAFVNSIKSLYRYHVLFNAVKPKQPEYIFLFTHTHQIHHSLLYDLFHSFLSFHGDYKKTLQVFKYGIMDVFYNELHGHNGLSIDKFVQILQQYEPEYKPNFQ